MKYFVLKLLPMFLVYFFTCSKEIYCQDRQSKRNDESYLIVENIFGQDSRIKTGDIMECEITKTNSMESSICDTHVFTQHTTQAGYVFYPASKDKKCFSYQVRTKAYPHVLLSATPSVVEDKKIEIILEYDGNSVIRVDGLTVKTPIDGIVNDRELRGFWIRWLDDQLLEVGRDTDNSPILSYRPPEKLSVNFIGIFSHTTTGEWILHKDPHCGIYNTSNKVKAESKCKVGTTNNFERNMSKIFGTDGSTSNGARSERNCVNQTMGLQIYPRGAANLNES